jgi:hypothetical protein
MQKKGKCILLDLIIDVFDIKGKGKLSSSSLNHEEFSP